MRQLGISLLLVLAGCASNSNNPIATYRTVDEQYEITMTGQRENMAHDPISYLFRGTSPSALTILVPRMTGEVLGSEIPVKKGYYSYLGNILFDGQSMFVDLYYDNTDKKTKEPIFWNGKYITQ
jgi:hypothetical protein